MNGLRRDAKELTLNVNKPYKSTIIEAENCISPFMKHRKSKKPKQTLLYDLKKMIL